MNEENAEGDIEESIESEEEEGTEEEETEEQEEEKAGGWATVTHEVSFLRDSEEVDFTEERNERRTEQKIETLPR